ncbi:unnamed protein product [Victoria cruziana]
MKGVSYRGNRICFGRYALQALEPAWITSRQIEAGHRAMSRYVHYGKKIWVRIFPNKPVTLRPAETHMGLGKGSPKYWVSIVKPDRILYKMGGVLETVARAAMEIEAHKMPIQTKFSRGGLSNVTPPPLVNTSRKLPGMKEQKLIHEGLITESLPNGMFWVRLDNEDLVLDRVKIKVSRYDSTRGCIIYRLRNKDSND